MWKGQGQMVFASNPSTSPSQPCKQGTFGLVPWAALRLIPMRLKGLLPPSMKPRHESQTSVLWQGKGHVWEIPPSEKKPGQENTYPVRRAGLANPPLIRPDWDTGPITVLGPERLLPVSWQGAGREEQGSK